MRTGLRCCDFALQDMMDALKFDYASERIVMDDLKADSSST